MSYFEVIHSSPEIQTLGDYCAQIDSPAFQYKGKETAFLLLKDDIGITNRERLISLYTPTEQKQNLSITDNKLLLKVGTRFVIPVEKIETVGLLTQGIEVISNDVPTFKAHAIAEIESDIEYYRSSKHIIEGGLSGDVSIHFPNLTVWVWVKALSDTTNPILDGKVLDDLQGELIDITPFVIRCRTSVGQNGGNYHLTLPPLVCSLYEEVVDGKTKNTWVVSKSSVNTYMYKGNKQSVGAKYWGQDNLYHSENKSKKRLIQNNFLFHTVLQTNDLVFIRYETLEVEKEQRHTDSIGVNSLIINKQNIAGRLYDMIGLVDTNSISVNTESHDISITISGRDLSKLFIDDGTYFFNLENITGQFRIAGKSTQDNELQGRLVGNNSLYYLSLYQNTSIEFIIKFIIQQLSSISIVPDSLFFSYGDRRNTSMIESGGKVARVQKQREIEQLSESLKSSIPYFSELYTFLEKIRRTRTRIVSGRVTVGWLAISTERVVSKNEVPSNIQEYNQIEIFNIYDVNQKTFIQDINSIDILLDLQTSSIDGNTKFTKVFARGIWQIVKLVIDKNVSVRRVVDSSMSQANGSLLNFIRKICQTPFVEFYTDTYGDQFNLIVRKPPYDKRSVTDYLLGNVHTEENTKTQPTIIDIEGHNVSQETLSLDDQQAFSWYSFKPQNVFAGGGSVLPTAYVPALYFEEYANIWGSRPLEIVHNYNPYYPFINNDGIVDSTRFELQAFEDLKYLIESHAHLPFTRRGSITLSNTDRRIKRGNLIRYLPTNEIFLVESVSHSTSFGDKVDASTIIQVSRGMVEELIWGIDIGETKNISYFNIINTQIDLSTKLYPKTTEKRKYKKMVEKKREVTSSTPKEETINDIRIDTIKLTQEQRDNAKTIYDTSKTLGASDRDIQIAYMTAIQESRLKNLKGGDRDSVGLFQQRPSMGWGTVVELTTPAIATTRFLVGKKSAGIFGLLSVKNRESMRLTEAAQYIQRSGFPEAYAQWEVQAKQLVDYFNNKNSTVQEPETYLEEEEFEEEVEVPSRVGVNREQVFSNVKVNRDIFNFFIKKHQFVLNKLSYKPSPR